MKWKWSNSFSIFSLFLSFTICHLLNLDPEINTNRSEADSMNKTESIVKRRNDYLFSYVSLILATVGIGLCRSLLHFSSTARMSSNLYSKMYESVIGSPIRFFDSNSIGTILNRFTSDISAADDNVPFLTYIISLVSNLDQISQLEKRRRTNFLML